jgi:hypothetical protein
LNRLRRAPSRIPLPIVKIMDELGWAISHPAVPAAPPAIQPTQNILKRSGATQGPTIPVITPKVHPAASVPNMPSQIDTEVPRRPPPKIITKTPAIAPNRTRFRRGGGFSSTCWTLSSRSSVNECPRHRCLGSFSECFRSSPFTLHCPAR